MRILYLGKSEEIYTILDEVASLSQSEVIKIGSVKEALDILAKDRNFHGVVAHPKVDNIPSLQVLAFMKRDESLKDAKGEEVVKQILHEAKKDKSILLKIIELIKKLFGKK